MPGKQFFQDPFKSYPVFSRSPSRLRVPAQKYRHGMWIMRACCTTFFTQWTWLVSAATYFLKRLAWQKMRNAPSVFIRCPKCHDSNEMPTNLENRHEIFMFTGKNFFWDMCSCLWCLKRKRSWRGSVGVIRDFLAWKDGKIMPTQIKLWKFGCKFTFQAV